MFFLLYRHTDDGVFYDFPKISDHFPTISMVIGGKQLLTGENLKKKT